MSKRMAHLKCVKLFLPFATGEKKFLLSSRSYLIIASRMDLSKAKTTELKLLCAKLMDTAIVSIYGYAFYVRRLHHEFPFVSPGRMETLTFQDSASRIIQ